ncbi:MAG: phosphomannomutase [Rhizobiaceae bacterium]
MTTCAKIIATSKAAFGTSGVRGLVTELDDATCFAYTTAFLNHMKTNKGLNVGSRVWVGHDLRPSSPRITNACIAAIEHAGMKAELCGEIPTPALAFCALGNKEPAIMITGSHIPFDRNGMKFYRPDGELMKEDEAPIINSVSAFPTELFSGKTLKTSPNKPINNIAITQWRERYLSTFPKLLNGLRIGHYQHSAAGRDLLASLLQELGADVVPLGRSNEFIPIDTEAVSNADKQQAKSWSKEHSLDLIISTDGDGDRPLLADENGTYFRGDALGGFAAHSLKATVISTPVSSTTALEKSGLFTKIHRTKIGSPPVIIAMQEAAKDSRETVVGFEPNGGFLTASTILSPMNENSLSPLPTRDALLPILATIALSKVRSLKLSELPSLFPNRATASDRIENTPRKTSLAILAHLKRDLNNAAILTPEGVAPIHLDETDGLRMTYPNGDIVHLRPSGNAPELRFYAECENDESAQVLQDHTRKVLNEMCSNGSFG